MDTENNAVAQLEDADLRDHFAGLALQGILAAGGATFVGGETAAQSVARRAYECADAMLAVRAKATGGAQ